MHEFTKCEIQTYFAVRVPTLKQTNAKHWRTQCPVHTGKGENFSVDADTGLCYCFSQCGKGWDVIGLEQELTGADFRTAKMAVWELVGRPPMSEEEIDTVATYDYTNEHGELLYQVVRLTNGPDGKKRFRQRQRSKSGAWINNLNGVEAVPYNLRNVVKSRFVAVCEGEKDANSLIRAGLTATCNSGGAEHFSRDLAPWFSDRAVAIFADNDEKGERHALTVAALLKPHAKSVRIVELPGLSLKGDVTDYIQRGGTIEEIRAAYKRAVEWTPGWQFGCTLPHENDKYIRTLAQCVEEAGGVDQFWDAKRHEGLPTPWQYLTRLLTGGLRNGEVYIIGANQGEGKTSLALQFVLHSMLRGVTPLLFSMEMGWEDVLQRLIGIRAQVDLAAFREEQEHQNGHLVDYTIKLRAATHELAEHDLLVSNKAGVSPKFLWDETKRLARRSKIGLVVIDHMQLMSAEKTARSEYEKFTSISRATKQVAMELKVPVLLVSQTSRNNSHDKRQELECSDLRGSGALEEDAAAILLLYPDGEDKRSASTEGGQRLSKGPMRAWMKLGKNRYGEQGNYIPMTHYKATTRFEMMM